MRIAGLLLLAIMFPVFACPPAGRVQAAPLININTANATLLDTLPGIGPSKAAAIIQYRTDHGPFARIEDIQNVSGIGASTYTDIAPFITVGDTSVPEPSPGGDSTASSTPPAATTTVPVAAGTVSSGPAEYLSLPQLRIITDGDRTVSSGADTVFSAVVYDGKGNRRDDALVAWSFGDGMRRVGSRVLHAYYGAGEYLAVVHAATADGGDALEEMIVTVRDAGIKIVSISSRGVTLANTDSRLLDLSFWRLSMGGQEFKIPEHTQILAGRTILLPMRVIELPVTDAASLLYPNGEVAAVYPVQLPPPAVSYKRVQAVEPIISTRTNVQSDEKEFLAPAATTELAAAGAAVSSFDTSIAADTATETSPLSKLLHSPWTLGFLSIVALAGGAFIFI